MKKLMLLMFLLMVAMLASNASAALNLLSKFPRERFIVYGHDKAEEAGNVSYRKFSTDGFIDDVASAKAIIATAGFTLISEALYLGKPYLAMPMRGQFEQELNALMIDQLGYGKRVTRPRSASIAEFLYRLPEYRERLNDYPRQGNGAIMAKLDELLAGDCALAREFYDRRRA